MIVNVSQVVVMILGIVICVLSAWGIYAPRKLVKMVKGVMDHDLGIHTAVIVRVVLGVALIFAAAESRFPGAFQVLGWIAIVAAVALALMGRKRLQRFVGWFDRFSPGLVRLWVLFGIAFGGFLIYGAI